MAITFPSALAAKAATPTIPIVFWSGGDPVEQGTAKTLGLTVPQSILVRADEVIE